MKGKSNYNNKKKEGVFEGGRGRGINKKKMITAVYLFIISLYNHHGLIVHFGGPNSLTYRYYFHDSGICLA